MRVDRIDRRAAGLRQRQAEEERGRAGRPPVPDRILEPNRATGHPPAVHVGDCAMVGRRRNPVGRDEARRLLTTDGIPACPICRPDTALGIALGIADLSQPGHNAPPSRTADRRRLPARHPPATDPA
ncbi:DUF6233 domain-containing protein [Streptomyces sp. NPDC001833]|uniref:DUF6233 domain-containing protein n=1 Tax=Streptomyces sp. NPDC001833 TaxID=3154658 RepID=UPI003323C3AF